MAEFTLDIAKFVEKAKVNPEKATKKAFFDVANRIVFRTPVLDGFLRNSWYAGVNQPNTSTGAAADKSGRGSLGSIESAIGKKTSGDFSLYLNNPLHYGPRIEFDGWSSVKAPAGMVRVSIAEFQSEIDKAARSLNI